MSKFVEGQSVWCYADAFSYPKEFWYQRTDWSGKWGIIKRPGKDAVCESRLLEVLHPSPLEALEAQSRMLVAQVTKYEGILVSAKSRLKRLRDTLAPVEEDIHRILNLKNP